jgi:glycosyltransferase involved in cell wall biosynthesis
LSKTLKISNKVKFLGFLDEQGKVQVMNDSDILISFSKSEGFPLVILEFFALGKPCIIYPISPFVYENGQLNEWGKKFQKEELGLFLKKEPDSLQEILKSPDIFQLFTENRSKARKEFVTEFSPEIIGNRYLTIFKQIIKSHLK